MEDPLKALKLAPRGMGPPTLSTDLGSPSHGFVERPSADCKDRP